MIKKLVIACASFIFLGSLFIVLPVIAQVNLGMDYAENLGLPNGNLMSATIGLIKLAMSFLGILAVIMLLYGGFTWMTSGGNEDRASAAKKTISSGIIGIIIILSSFLIVNFVIQNVTIALNSGA
jgi:hypothetical protein